VKKFTRINGNEAQCSGASRFCGEPLAGNQIRLSSGNRKISHYSALLIPKQRTRLGGKYTSYRALQVLNTRFLYLDLNEILSPSPEIIIASLSLSLDGNYVGGLIFPALESGAASSKNLRSISEFPGGKFLQWGPGWGGEGKEAPPGNESPGLIPGRILTAGAIGARVKSRAELIVDDVVDVDFRQSPGPALFLPAIAGIFSALCLARANSRALLAAGLLAVGSALRAARAVGDEVGDIDDGGDVGRARAPSLLALAVRAVEGRLDRLGVGLDEPLPAVRVAVTQTRGVGAILLEALVQAGSRVTWIHIAPQALSSPFSATCSID
jgi:hypothetical protein